MKENVDSILALAKKLEKETENELNWLKINNLFVDLLKEKNLDFLKVMRCVPELILRSFLSERSKLSSSVFLFLRAGVVRLGADVPQDEVLLDACFKLCGRANRVFNKRGEELLLLLAEKTNLMKHVKMLKYNSKSLNKKVRKAVYLGIEMNLKSCTDKDRAWAVYEVLIKLGEKDPDIEGRSVCKRILLGRKPDMASKNFSLGQTVGSSAAKKEIKTNFPFLQRVPVRTNNVQEPCVKTEEVRDSFKSYLKRHNDEMKKLFSEKIAFNKVVNTPPKKQVRGVDQLKRKAEVEQRPQNILEYTPRGLNKYLEQYREEVQRLKVSPINETEKDDLVKNGASLKLWEENDELFAKEMLKFKEIKVPDKFELSFEDDGKAVESEQVVLHPSTVVDQHDDAGLNTRETANVQMGSINENLLQSNLAVNHGQKISTTHKHAAHSTQRDQRFVFAGNEVINENTANVQDTYTNISNKNQDFYFEDEIDKEEQKSGVNTEVTTQPIDENVIICDNEHFNFFGNQDLKFENLDKFSVMTQEEFLSRSAGSVSQEVIKEDEDGLIHGQESIVNESYEPQKDVRADRTEKAPVQGIEDDDKYYAADQQELGEKTIVQQLELANMEYKNANGVSFGDINGDKHSNNEQIMLLDEKSSSVKSTEVYDQVDQEFDDLSATMPSQVSRDSRNDEQGNTSKYSFLEESFNSLGVTDDANIVNMPTLNEGDMSSGSVFEGSCVKNRFEDAVEESTAADKTQIGEFSNIGTVLQFNKKTLRKESDDHK